MTKIDVYRQILRDTIRDDMQLEDVSLVALVLHTHSIALRAHISLDDFRQSSGDQRLVLAPLTRTHVAELTASLWPRNDERGRDNFWYFLYDSLVPYELFGEVPEALRDRAMAARDSIAGHPLVHELIED